MEDIPRRLFDAWDATSYVGRIWRVQVLGGELVALDVFTIFTRMCSPASSGAYDCARIFRGARMHLKVCFILDVWREQVLWREVLT